MGSVMDGFGGARLAEVFATGYRGGWPNMGIKGEAPWSPDVRPPEPVAVNVAGIILCKGSG